VPLTLSVALPRSGLRDLTPHLARQRQDRCNAPPRQRRRASPIQSALPSSTNLALPACARLCQTKPTICAIHAIHEHSLRSPETPDFACPMGFEPHLGLGFGPAPSSSITGWCSDPCGATPTELRRVRTRSAFAAQETSHGRDSRGVDQAGLYPDPSNLDTFCRELAGLPAGEADSPRRLRTFTEPTRDLNRIRTSRVLPRVPDHGPAFAKPAAFRPACAGRSAVRTASRPAPRREERSAAPKVSSVLRRHLQTGSPGPENRARTIAARRVDLCPQVVPILWIRGPRFSFIPRHAVL
jgi:hypothetical protein